MKLNGSQTAAEIKSCSKRGRIKQRGEKRELKRQKLHYGEDRKPERADLNRSNENRPKALCQLLSFNSQY